MKYVNTNAEGKYSLSGAIFLDYANSKDFSDFNSILYGHHMAKRTMFGELGEFSSKEKFDAHRYGNIYFDGNDHGIEFFAYLHTDAYDSGVFAANVGDEHRQAYLDGLLEKSIHVRNIGVTVEDRIVLLSTCSIDSTNGRDILVGRLMDDLPNISSQAKNDIETSVTGTLDCTVLKIPIWTALLAAATPVFLVVRAFRYINKKKEGRKL